jgi:hypothetical protein
VAGVTDGGDSVVGELHASIAFRVTVTEAVDGLVFADVIAQKVEVGGLCKVARLQREYVRACDGGP